MQVCAVQIERTGGPDVLTIADVDIGEPGPGQVRVRHHACGINFIDTGQLRGGARARRDPGRQAPAVDRLRARRGDASRGSTTAPTT